MHIPCVPVVHRVHVYTVAVLAGVRCAAVLANTVHLLQLLLTTTRACAVYALHAVPYTLCAWLHRVHAQQQMLAGACTPAAAAAALVVVSSSLCVWVRAPPEPAAGRRPAARGLRPREAQCSALRGRVLRSGRCYACLHPPCYSVHCVLCSAQDATSPPCGYSLHSRVLASSVFHTVCMRCYARSLRSVATLPSCYAPSRRLFVPLVVGLRMRTPGVALTGHTRLGCTCTWRCLKHGGGTWVACSLLKYRGPASASKTKLPHPRGDCSCRSWLVLRLVSGGGAHAQHVHLAVACGVGSAAVFSWGHLAVSPYSGVPPLRRAPPVVASLLSATSLGSPTC